jgi:hypothetical protein
MNRGDRATRFAVAFARGLTRSPAATLCSVCADMLEVSGAGITVMGGGQAGPVCVSSQRMSALEDVQFTMGQGPCQDAYNNRRPVHAPRLDPDSVARWPSFFDVAQDIGVHAVFAYPLSIVGTRVGVLTLYQDLEGELTAQQHEDSLVMADVLTETVLSLQDEAPQGELAAGLAGAVAYRAEIHQASGMVAVQLQIPVAEALVRIRGNAFASGRSIGLVAGDIVKRLLRLADDRDELSEGV